MSQASPNSSTILHSQPLLAEAGDASEELERRVSAHIQSTESGIFATRGMWLKAVLLAAWIMAAYGFLLVGTTSVWSTLGCATALAVGIAAFGFNVQHDAGHGSFSSSAAVNRTLAFTLDLVGASSYMWRYKHNVFHHQFTNVQGQDDDIALWVRLGRRAGRRIHQWQHLYIWIFYSALLIKWTFFDDFVRLIRGRIGAIRFPRPRGRELGLFIAGKVLFLTWAFALPLLFHDGMSVVLVYLFVAGMVGMIASFVFQLAHCVDETEFVTRSSGAPGDWVSRQLASTADFGQNSNVLGWFVGGLNFQIEHHLFPHVAHGHYPSLAKIVSTTTADFGLPYLVHPTALDALRSHYRWLRRLSRSGLRAPGESARDHHV